METFIRKSLRMKAHRVREVREEEERIVAVVERMPHRKLRCGECGQAVRARGAVQAEREWRDLPLRDRPLVIRYAPLRIWCGRCRTRRVERVPWARGKWQRVTDDLALSVARLARRLSWAETAALMGLDWKSVAAIVRRVVAKGLEKRRWKPLHWIGIDEVSRSKGQKYLTLVYDLDRSRLVWVGEGRKRETMERFFAWLGRRRARSIRVVCCDMWAAYLEAVREHLPEAQVVFDRFHVVKHLNAAVDEVRREMWRKLSGPEKRAFKRTRWLWLKNPWNLTPKEGRRLSDLCRRNLPIVRAYYLKEAFQRFWDYLYPRWAIPYLQQWLHWAIRCRLKPLVDFAKMIRRHLGGILAWTKLRVSNGALEGMNNKVKVISHRAYGFRKVATYMTAIWHACGNLPLTL